MVAASASDATAASVSVIFAASSRAGKAVASGSTGGSPVAGGIAVVGLVDLAASSTKGRSSISVLATVTTIGISGTSATASVSRSRSSSWACPLSSVCRPSVSSVGRSSTAKRST